jgi:hypothetical protein
MMAICRNKDIRWVHRGFEEAQDAALVKMRMIAIWEAQEGMKRGS